MVFRPLRLCILMIVLYHAAGMVGKSAVAGDKIGDFAANPPLLSASATSTSPTSETDKDDHREGLKSLREANDEATTTSRENRRKASWLRRARAVPEAVDREDESGADTGVRMEAPDLNEEDDSPPAPPIRDVVEAPLPTPEGVERYRLRLEERLLERYNNLPEFAGRVGRVGVVLARPLEYSMDGRLIRAEFDQIVHDVWGKRLPALEKEYYVVTFGSGGAEAVRSDPSVRVGLDLEKTYSERAPLAADPFRNVDEGDAFRKTPTVKMPDWWRPEFRDLE